MFIDDRNVRSAKSALVSLIVGVDLYSLSITELFKFSSKLCVFV